MFVPTPDPDDLAVINTVVDMLAEFDGPRNPITITGQLPGLYAHQATLDELREFVRGHTQ